ncbi:MAG TPA: M28 family peptidase [Gemmatimonadales bacterium]|nr:M28 family peptidase [Gemmatimonadales bacterium]
MSPFATPPRAGTRPDASAAAAMVAELAREPRAAGGEGEAAARDSCARWLRSLGFQVSEERFTYSALPGRWATPAAAAAMLGLVMLSGHVGYRGYAGAALAVLLAGGLFAAACGVWVARRGVLVLPFMRREGVNLIASRGAAGELPCWFMAHLDSKSQPVPIAVRAVSIVLLSVAFLLSVVYAAAQVAGAVDGSLWPYLAILAGVCALPAMLSTVGNRSQGALDNASGVAAVLMAAEALGEERSVGICITSAEELGLAGSRAWISARAADAPRVVLNVDSLDDSGDTVLMWSRRKPEAIMEACGRGALSCGARLVRRRLIPGILTDGVAVADGGWPVVTVSRGTLRTLLRIHSERDSPELLSGTGVAETAELLAAVADTLSGGST